jgi:hypothetical protein
VSATIGVTAAAGPLEACAGGQTARGETVSGTDTRSDALFGGAGIQLLHLAGVDVAAFGVLTAAVRDGEPLRGIVFSTRDLAARAGFAIYPRSWVGLRVYQDFASGGSRLGLSLGLVVGARASTRDRWRRDVWHDADGDGVEDSVDECPATLPRVRVAASGCSRLFGEDAGIVLQDLQIRRHELPHDVLDRLDRFAQAMMSDPTATVEIIGHADGTWREEFSQRLSLERAELVRAYLVGRGVESDRFTVLAVGSSRPLASDGSAGGRAKNRRVELRRTGRLR